MQGGGRHVTVPRTAQATHRIARVRLAIGQVVGRHSDALTIQSSFERHYPRYAKRSKSFHFSFFALTFNIRMRKYNRSTKNIQLAVF